MTLLVTEVDLSSPKMKKPKKAQKLWVEYKTPEKTFIDKVSIEECDDVADFLKEIKKEFEIPGPSSQLTLYRPDGSEIDVGDSPSLLIDGNSRNNPLIVKTTAQGTL